MYLCCSSVILKHKTSGVYISKNRQDGFMPYLWTHSYQGRQKKTLTCPITTCQAIFHGKCLNPDEGEFERLRASRKNWACPNCVNAQKSTQLSDKGSSPARSALQHPTASDDASQLLMTTIRDLTAEVKGLKFALDANASETTVIGAYSSGTGHFTSIPLDENTLASRKLPHLWLEGRLPTPEPDLKTWRREGGEEKMSLYMIQEESIHCEGLEFPPRS
ncbi:unnamed protein product [Nezara viridula]|uniref:Uncharacterized protein n=1 Tax=Nezara viridula TaxID=85310 RepID=A0A9P0E539_NEZVI|nr:unnamed protein product [Nezara viridula]